MSRKFDVLFAERVLGCKVGFGKVLPHHPMNYDPGEPVCCCGSDEDGYSCKHDSRDEGTLTTYTTSLDSAWPGVEKVRPLLGVLFTYLPFNDEWRCHLRVEDADTYPSDDGAHPALALVKACLLAVGVTQEEMDASDG